MGNQVYIYLSNYTNVASLVNANVSVPVNESTKNNIVDGDTSTKWVNDGTATNSNFSLTGQDWFGI